jgi:hypothetical protein
MSSSVSVSASSCACDDAWKKVGRAADGGRRLRLAVQAVLRQQVDAARP